jgi:hypothetical protein
MRRGISDSGGRWSGWRREEERPSAVLCCCCCLLLRGRGTWAAAAERKAAAREEEAMAGDGRVAGLAGPLVGWWPLKEKAICYSVCGVEESRRRGVPPTAD